MNFVKFLRTPFFTEHLRWLLLYRVSSGTYFPEFSPNTGKYGPEKTLYLNTFHEVQITVDVNKINKRYKENILNISDGRKPILSLFTGRKKRKTWNKTRGNICKKKEDKI